MTRPRTIAELSDQELSRRLRRATRHLVSMPEPTLTSTIADTRCRDLTAIDHVLALGQQLATRMTHARRGHECEICGRTIFGNGGRVAHARTHVRAGEAVEVVKDLLDGQSRVFVPVADEPRIAELRSRGWTVETAREE